MSQSNIEQSAKCLPTDCGKKTIKGPQLERTASLITLASLSNDDGAGKKNVT